ncbi:hypothetical protein IB276_22550 [Ensifer sp. ENS04]|uniref:hypothetical protein n=1 Tax=Ensifer sp. ENS04 TaxID=2769281 RepID=UPI00177F5D0B|nr:hypothetical protein [Ensifer sp. ENS04]MBD9542229.1 hypothetical protein [Ensifer sp. ENS04]
MAVAIKTKFLGPTNTRGSRIKAEACDKGPFAHAKRQVVLSWDHSMDAQGNHAAAAKALATKLEWDGEWHIADGGDVYIFVRTGSWSHVFDVA